MDGNETRSPAFRMAGTVRPVRYGIGLAILWTLALAASLWWLLRLQGKDEEAAAAITARVAYEADVKYLNWLSALGGLYVRTEEPFPPDPHFGGLPEHQFHLPDGSAVMPLTPIYVLRLVHELDIVPLEVSSSLRSLTPTVPEDEPDPWERRALQALAEGRREVAEISAIDGETYLRLMKPLRIGRDCITCHEKAGYREGTLQGGISVTVPMDRPEEFGQRADGYVYATHGLLWVVGLGLIGYGTRNLTTRIRERDEALVAVSQERAFSDSVLETVGALVAVLDRQGRIVRFNRACEEATGYGFAAVRGQPVWDALLAPEDRDPFRERFARLLADQAPAYHETPWIDATGAARIIAWSDTPLVGAGRVEHVIATGIDVTEARRTEQAQRESEARYRTLVENVQFGITLITPDHRVVMSNAAQRRLFARHPGSFTGERCYRVFQGRDGACPECPGVQALATGAPASLETVRLRDDGRSVPVRIQAFPILAPDSSVTGLIEVIEDITPLKEAAEERLKLEQKVQQAQKLESLGVLAGGIAHDFNNLLMGVLANVDLALAKAPPESLLRPYLLKIDGAAQRAADLTAQMLAYSGRGRFVVEPIDLSRLVEELGYLLDTVVSKKASLRYLLAPAPPPVLADATQLRQVVMNLITNASDALGDRSGTVTVATGAVEVDRAYLAQVDFGEEMGEGRYVYVEVTDDGCGMTPETRSRVFDPFFTTKQTGRGLGLAAVLGIVRGHRGGLCLRSEAGHGTSFRVLFPAAEAPYPNGSGPPDAATLPGARLAGKVLVVDDDAMVRAATQDMLEELGFSVLTATDGVDGVETLQANLGAVAVVVLDMTMPRMNGEEALHEMRRLRPDLPVVLCSGFNEQDVAERHQGERLSRFLHKPYRTQELLTALDALCSIGTP